MGLWIARALLSLAAALPAAQVDASVIIIFPVEPWATGYKNDPFPDFHLPTVLAHPDDTSVEFGDEITMARAGLGVAIDFSFLGTPCCYGPRSDLTLRLYQNDGPAGAPGTLLFQVTRSQFTLGDLLSLDRTPLPQTFTWTVELSGIHPGSAPVSSLAIVAGDGHDVGWSDPNYFWRRDPSSGQFTLASFTGGPSNFALEVQLVPEPGPLLLAGSAMLALGCRWAHELLGGRAGRTRQSRRRRRRTLQ